MFLRGKREVVFFGHRRLAVKVLGFSDVRKVLPVPAGWARATRFVRGVADLLFPPRCVWCEAEAAGRSGWAGGGLLCTDCADQLGPQRWNCCRRCGGEVPEESHQPDQCAWCRNSHLEFDSVVALGNYHGPLRAVVNAMKGPSGGLLSEAMARLLFERRETKIRQMQPDLILAVPHHWRRRLGRGANSAETMARSLSRQLGLVVPRTLVVRWRNTPPQKELPPKARFRNVRDAFAVRATYDLRDARALVVDDTLTTGATCSEIAWVLKQSGAAAVHVAVLARAQGTSR